MGRSTSLHDKKFPMKIYWKNCAKKSSSTQRTCLKPLMSLFSQDTQVRTGQLCLTETNGSLVCVEQNTRGEQFRCPQRRQVYQHEEVIREQNQKGKGRDTSKDRQPGVCTPWTSKGSCSPRDSCSFKHDTKGMGKVCLIPRSLPIKREGTRKVTEKEVPKEREPKVPVRQESQTSWYATIFKSSRARWNPHVISGTHQSACSRHSS